MLDTSDHTTRSFVVFLAEILSGEEDDEERTVGVGIVGDCNEHEALLLKSYAEEFEHYQPYPVTTQSDSQLLEDASYQPLVAFF